MAEVTYGQLESEKFANQNLQCRHIVGEVLNLGITQRQIWTIIYLLGLELENVSELHEVTGMVKEIRPDALISNYGVKNG